MPLLPLLQSGSPATRRPGSTAEASTHGGPREFSWLPAAIFLPLRPFSEH